MAWRTAKSLDALRAQINAAFPNRSKSSDGTIGNAEHASRSSDHNPWVKDGATGIVTALDITHDPAHGVDAGALAERLRLSRDRRIKYIISNKRIANYQAVNGEAAWTWRPYHGANDHTHHFHVSVRPEKSLYDDTSPWVIGGKVPVPVTPTPVAGSRFTNITATVFGGADDPNASAYGGQVDPDKPGVALPYRFSGPRPKVRIFYQGRSVVCDIVDVGPWNTSDAYWQKGARPQAEIGRDIRGRKTNLAGIDMTPAAAVALKFPGLGKVDWEFVSNAVPSAAVSTPPTKVAAKEAATVTAGATALGGFVVFGQRLLEHPILAILATAAVVGVLWFGWTIYRKRRENAQAANVEANKPVPVDSVPALVSLPPARLAKRLNGRAGHPRRAKRPKPRNLRKARKHKS